MNLWNHIILSQRLSQYLRPLKVEYNPDLRFHENRSRTVRILSLVMDSNLILIYLLSLIGFKQFITDTPEDPSDKESIKRFILRGVFQLLWIGCSHAFLSASWSIRYRHQPLIGMLNHAMAAYQKRQTSNKDGIFVFVVWTCFVAVTLAMLTVTLTPLVYNTTPGNLLLSIVWPVQDDDLSQSVRMIRITICILYQGIVTLYGGWATLSPALIYSIAGFYESGFVVPHDKAKAWKRPILPHDVYKTYQAERNSYNQSVIFVKKLNNFGFAFYPVLMSGGFCINITTSFICIKYSEALGTMLALVIGIFDIVVIVVTAGLHTFAVGCKEESEKFVLYWKPKLYRKLERTQIRCWRPVVIYIGSFFVLERKILLLTYDQIVDQTVALLILDS